MKVEIISGLTAVGAGIAAKVLKLHIWPFLIVAAIAGPAIYFRTEAYTRLVKSVRIYRRRQILGNAIIYAMAGCLAVMIGYAIMGGRGL